MGWTQWFGKKPLSEAKIKKVAKLASNPFAQTDIRMREMQRLLDEGSEAALTGVLKRFASNASGAIADEDEKKWLEDALVDKGEPALKPLQSYIRTEKQLTYALRAYQRIGGTEEAVAFFLRILQDYGPEDYRSAEAKLQLVWQLAESLADQRVVPALCPFLQDHSDDVRWAVMDLMEKAADDGLLNDEQRSTVCTHFGRLVSSTDEAPRIQQRAAHILCQREWKVPKDIPNLSVLLEDSYFVDKKQFVRKRVKLNT